MARIGLRLRVTDRIRPPDGRAYSRRGGIGKPERPQRPRHYREARYPTILASGPRGQALGLAAGVKSGTCLLAALESLGEAAHEQQVETATAGGVDEPRPITAGCGKRPVRFSRIERPRQLAAHAMDDGQPMHHLRIFRRIPEPLAEFAGAREGFTRSTAGLAWR